MDEINLSLKYLFVYDLSRKIFLLLYPFVVKITPLESCSLILMIIDVFCVLLDKNNAC